MTDPETPEPDFTLKQRWNEWKRMRPVPEEAAHDHEFHPVLVAPRTEDEVGP
ncbi:MAG: hypothetical protein M3408_13070 [Actinomycetota bacterium]|jgi:hypothetical protein|nr:hypothetical protein [Actinomycetota bacterium]